jgi:hypothetical protein
MAEKDTVFSSKIKYGGIFSFSELYKFCYGWLTEETGLSVSEEKYVEKLSGDSKDVEFEWSGSKKLTDYFKISIAVKFKITGLINVELVQDGKKIKSNKGSVEISVKGILIRDYDGKFEATSFQKVLRGIYEKWIISSKIEDYRGKVFGDCDEFLQQAKSFLDLEGKR